MFLGNKYTQLILDNRLTDNNLYMNGIIEGYPVILFKDVNLFAVKINCTKEDDPGNGALGRFIEGELSQLPQYQNYRSYAHHVEIRLNIKKAKDAPEIINTVVTTVINHLQAEGYSGCCEESGNTEEPLECYDINNTYHYLCQASADSVYQSLVARQQNIVSQKSDFLPGIVGAIIGATAGVAVWVVLSKLGFISALAGWVMGVCALMGYEKLGKHLDAKGVIGCIVVIVVMVFVANYVSWALAAYDGLKSYGWTLGECFEGLSYILEQTDLTGSYIRDLLLGYGLTALGTGGRLIAAMNEAKGKFSFKK